jgi:hypothetical protein
LCINYISRSGGTGENDEKVNHDHQFRSREKKLGYLECEAAVQVASSLHLGTLNIGVYTISSFHKQGNYAFFGDLSMENKNTVKFFNVKAYCTVFK